MKKVILNILFICICYPARLQNDSRDTVYLSTTDFKRMFDEKYYTVLSNKNFEEYTTNKVKSEINGRWDNFLAWLLGVGVIIAGFIYGYLRTEQNSKIAQTKTLLKEDNDNKINDKFEELESRLNEKISHAYLTTVQSQYEKQFKDLEKRYYEKITEIDLKFQEIERKTQTSSVNMIRTEVNSLKAAESNTQEDYDRLKQFLAEAEKLNDNRLLSETINVLAKVGYTLAKTNEIAKVLETNMEKEGIDIDANAYLNVASSFFYDYASSNDPELAKTAFKFLNKSLQKIEKYGEALALKLEFLMVDLELTRNPEEKENIRHKAAVILEQIAESTYSTAEAKARFKRVSENPTEGKYVNMLKKEFKEAMTTLGLGANNPKAKGAQ